MSNHPSSQPLTTAVSIHYHDGYVVVAPSGEIDAAATPQLRAATTKIRDQSQVVIDLSAVTFIDSAGLGALIGAVRRTQEDGGTISIACDRPSLLRLLDVVGFEKLVPIRATVDAALTTAGHSR